jgi:hypothetical protein
MRKLTSLCLTMITIWRLNLSAKASGTTNSEVSVEGKTAEEAEEIVTKWCGKRR